jgi:hypothetical protein
VSDPVTRTEWRLVRVRNSGCRAERRVYGRRSTPEAALELFADYAPYGLRDVEWEIEEVKVTEQFKSLRIMTASEVAAVTEAEAARLSGAH